MTIPLASCGVAGLETDPCAAMRPILVSQLDALTRETAQQVLAHNETWARLCR